MKLVGKAQTLDATRIEHVGKGIERDGKREDRAFYDEGWDDEAQDRPSKAQDVMATRQREEINPKSEVGNHEIHKTLGKGSAYRVSEQLAEDLG
jgi:hypothetical protein